jgi:eukaryotic-like serine/threonine-protein kinase
MQSNPPCILCDQPAKFGTQTCEAHQTSFGTAETIMPNSGAMPKVSLSPRATGESPRHTSTYAPALSPSGEQEIFGRGAQLGEYVIEEKIGEGGMGEVWSARQPTINKRVAVKLLNLRIKNDPIQLARFKREALIVNQVKHRHLVDIFSFGELPDKRPYFVMEFLEGETLTSFLKQRGTLPFQTIGVLFGQLCRALQAAHEHGVVHRDLKPDNIFMLSGDDEIFVKILDFGIAKLDEDESLTKTGTRFGTPTYMSPEQCRESKNVDARSDVYALGIILYELLCGKTPFSQKGDPVVRVMIRHQSELPKPPSAVVPHRNIPRALDEIVLQALEKEEAKRPQSCTEFYAALKKALPKSEDATIVDLPKTQAPALVVAPKSHSAPPGQTRAVVAIVVSAALLGVSAAAFLAKSNKKAAPEAQRAAATTLESLAVSQPSSTPASLIAAAPASAPSPTPAAEAPEKITKNKTKTKTKATEKTPEKSKEKTAEAPKETTKPPPTDSVLKNNSDATLKPKFDK